jgi:uncharacterized protein YrrD
MSVEIRLGAAVVTSDGAEVGKVDRIVVEPDTQEFLEIVVHKGFWFSEDRIIAMEHIDHVNDDGAIVLNIDRQRAGTLPPFAMQEYRVAKVADIGSYPMPGGTGSSMVEPILWRESRHEGQLQDASAARYEHAVLESSAVEARSNLPFAAISITDGTDVIDSAHEKLGEVDELLYDEQGHISGFVMRAGFFHREKVAIPVDIVAGITHEYVRLSITGDELKARDEG